MPSTATPLQHPYNTSSTPMQSVSDMDASSFSSPFVPLLSFAASRAHSFAATPAPPRQTDKSSVYLHPYSATPGQTFVPFTPFTQPRVMDTVATSRVDSFATTPGQTFVPFTPFRPQDAHTNTSYGAYTSENLRSILPLSPMS
jgi:hypothetical protein